MVLSGDVPVLAVTGFFTIALGLIILLWGFISARSKKFNNHRKLMITAVFVLVAFLVQYIVRAAVLHQETRFSGPENIRNYVYIPILIVHISFAIITIVLISWHLTHSLKNEQETNQGAVYFPKDYRGKHRRLGRISFTLWMFSYLGGLTIFLMLYVIYN